MYEKIAWSNFIKTGDIESFIEYRRLMDLGMNIPQIKDQNEGELLNELNKNKGDSNKRNIV